MNRRQFLGESLGLALASTVFLATGCRIKLGHKSVVIIGAGIAGLAAARYLRDRGFPTVVLEARNRIGGRIWTDREHFEAPVELGANWIHGIDQNPIFSLANQAKLQTLTTDYASQFLVDGSGLAFTTARKNQLDTNYTNFISYLNIHRHFYNDNTSLGQVMDDYLNVVKLQGTDLSDFLYQVNTTIEHEYAADVSELSALNFDLGEELSGPDVVLPEGYDQILQNQAKDLEIRLEHPVTRIEYDDDGVAVFTNKGKLEAGFAVCTVPLGVLQSGAIAFSPQLPHDKWRSILQLKMGILNKVILKFDSQFWGAKDFLEFADFTRKGYFAEWLNITKYDSKNILLGFNAAKFGSQSELLTDKELVSQALGVLRTMFGNIPEPTTSVITRWGADPFSLGSYSYTPPGATPADYHSIAHPLNRRLFFAGEHTSATFPATVHGAFLSGIKAAQHIHQLV